MKIKYNKILNLTIIIFIILLLFYIGANGIINIDEIQTYFKDKSYPIDTDTGIINNEYFKINSQGEEPEATTNGINEAIKYAKDNNIKNLKLETGIYKIIGYNNSHYRGIVLQSNINLDLNGSKIIQETNDKNTYANVTMYEIENSSIFNGILIGDKIDHNYNPGNGETHEDGYGISIVACNNIKVSNLEIYNMTGDGINIYGINKGEKTCYDIKVENNNIHDCRRQGITIGCGEKIIINNNEIHDISGTEPQAAIDLESNFQTEIIDEVTIVNNKIYNLGNINALLLVGFINNVEILSNEIEQSVLVYDAKETIKVSGNIIENGNVRFSNDYTNINAGHDINNLIFENNQLINTSLRLSKIANAQITNNIIQNGNIEFVSSNGKIDENQLENTGDNIDIAIELSNISGHTEKYKVNIGQNVIQGNYTEYFWYDDDFFEIYY